MWNGPLCKLQEAFLLARLHMLSKIFPSVLILHVSDTNDLGFFWTIIGIAALAQILLHRAVLWHHVPTLIEKVLLLIVPKIILAGFHLKHFLVNCRGCFSFWIFRLNKAGAAFFYNKGLSFFKNNYFLRLKWCAKAFSCHSFTSEFCFPPVDVATSEGNRGSSVFCMLLIRPTRQ